MNLPLKPGESKPHLSQSAVTSFLMCAHAFYLDKFEPEARKRPRGLRVGLGAAAHKAVEENAKFKIETEVDLHPSTVLDIFSDAFDRQAAECEVGPDDIEEAGSADAVVGATKDHGAAMVSLYRKDVAPDTMPLAVEERFNIELDGPYDIVGYIDMIDVTPAGGRVRDSKFGNKSHDPEQWLQGDFYALGYAALHHGELPAGLQLDVYKRPTKKLPARYEAMPTTRDVADTERALAVADVVYNAIDAGIFPPNGLGTWKCGMKFCDFWPCKYVRAVTPAEVGVAQQIEADIQQAVLGSDVKPKRGER